MNRPPDRPTARPPATPGSAPPTTSSASSPTAPRRCARPRPSPSAAEYRIPIGRIVAPRLAEPDESFQRLRALAYAGAERRYGTVAPVTRERLERELGIIGQKGFADYFLVVKDIVEHGAHPLRPRLGGQLDRELLSRHHPRRARSAPGSSSSASSIPSARIRPTSTSTSPGTSATGCWPTSSARYPRPQAAMVANHNCFRLRGALREVAKVHGRPAGEIREVTRRIPIFEDEPLEELLATHPNFQGLDLAAQLAGLRPHGGAAGGRAAPPVGPSRRRRHRPRPRSPTTCRSSPRSRRWRTTPTSRCP